MRNTAFSRREIGSDPDEAAHGNSLIASDVLLRYPVPGGEQQIVLDIDMFAVPAGAMVGITGPSGCGKSSLLHVLCGLVAPS